MPLSDTAIRNAKPKDRPYRPMKISRSRKVQNVVRSDTWLLRRSPRKR